MADRSFPVGPVDRLVGGPGPTPSAYGAADFVAAVVTIVLAMLLGFAAGFIASQEPTRSDPFNCCRHA